MWWNEIKKICFIQVFEWEKSVQDTILSSFFWGYVVLQVPAGMLAGRFGGKFLILAAMVCTGVVNLVLPLAAVHVSNIKNDLMERYSLLGI